MPTPRRTAITRTAGIPVWCLYVCPGCGAGTVAPTAYAVSTQTETDTTTATWQGASIKKDLDDQLRHVVEKELKTMDAGVSRVGDRAAGMKCVCPTCGHYGFTKKGQKGIFGRYRYLSGRETAAVLAAAYKSPMLMSRSIRALKSAAVKYDAYRGMDWDALIERCEHDPHCKTCADEIMKKVY